ncbi:glyoxalase [Thalassotalea insulae]|uniref:Glyoxalase n=1 Tax=Thalassotalea insulae TaxID=2056778 RepID=A0ABQ6GTD9_9GAMM|nr:VOC family protein [Thalassotalea insulae]GLX78622.1 glyoxalase [Thalassotalea insulae]
MIRIEHLNLVVADLEQALTFYQAAFPYWKIRQRGQSPWSGKMRNWLHFGDDFQYLTFNDNGVGTIRELAGHQVGLAHFAFVVTNLEQVIQRLEQAGFNIAKSGADEPFRRNVYFIDNDGFEVEFVEYLSDLPEQRNLSIS